MASLGEQLKANRLAVNKSLDDIANDTNIKKQYLEALEKDDYDSLPGRVYVRGFLRAYAKCVNLDPKVLTDQYDKMTTIHDLLSGKDVAESVKRIRREKKVILKRVFMLFAALLLAIVCLIILLWQRKG
jgi:cytoskeletal protein RodZ